MRQAIRTQQTGSITKQTEDTEGGGPAQRAAEGSPHLSDGCGASGGAGPWTSWMNPESKGWKGPLISLELSCGQHIYFMFNPQNNLITRNDFPGRSETSSLSPLNSISYLLAFWCWGPFIWWSPILCLVYYYPYLIDRKVEAQTSEMP